MLISEGLEIRGEWAEIRRWAAYTEIYQCCTAAFFTFAHKSWWPGCIKFVGVFCLNELTLETENVLKPENLKFKFKKPSLPRAA